MAAGDGVRWDFIDDGLDQLSDDDHSNAGARDDNVPNANDGLGNVHHCDHASVRFASFDCGAVDAAFGSGLADWFLFA